jgi:hypothetical protein
MSGNGCYGAIKVYTGSKSPLPQPDIRPQVRTLASLAETFSNCSSDAERKSVPPCTIFAVAVSSLLPKLTANDVCSCFSIIDDSIVDIVDSKNSEKWNTSPVTLQIWTMNPTEAEQTPEGFATFHNIEFGDVIRLQAAAPVWFGNQVQVNVSMRIRACAVHVFSRSVRMSGKYLVQAPIQSSGVSLYELTSDDIARAEQLSDWWRSLNASSLTVRVSPYSGRVVTMRELCADHLPHGIKDHVDMVCCYVGISSDLAGFIEKTLKDKLEVDGFFTGGGPRRFKEADKFRKNTSVSNADYEKGKKCLTIRAYPDSYYKTSSKELFEENNNEKGGIGKDYFIYVWDSTYPDSDFKNPILPEDTGREHWAKQSPRFSSNPHGHGGIIVRMKMDAGLPYFANLELNSGDWVRLRNVKRINANVASGRGEPRLFFAEQSGIMRINEPEKCFQVKHLLGVNALDVLEPLPLSPPREKNSSPKMSIVDNSAREDTLNNNNEALPKNDLSSALTAVATSAAVSVATASSIRNSSAVPISANIAATAAGKVLSATSSTTASSYANPSSIASNFNRGSSYPVGTTKGATGQTRPERTESVKMAECHQDVIPLEMRSNRDGATSDQTELIQFASKAQSGLLTMDELSRMEALLKEQRDLLKRNEMMAERKAIDMEPVLRIITESGSAHDLVNVSKVREVAQYVHEMEKEKDLECKVFRVLASVLAVFPADIRQGSRSVLPLSKKLKRSVEGEMADTIKVGRNDDEKSLFYNSELLSELPSHSTHYFHYVLRLTDVEPPQIGESAAVIEATLFGRDAETFLPGHTASDLFVNDRQFSAIEAKFASLIKSDAAGYFCVRVYRSAGGAKDAPVRLRIFDCYLTPLDDETS